MVGNSQPMAFDWRQLVIAMRIPLGVIAYFGAIGLAMRLPQPIQDTAVGYLIIPIILAVFAGVCAGLVHGMAAVDAKWRKRRAAREKLD